ncbi:MAG: SDR family NAD(P)-dependent oxidoreductase [Acidimicrobiales bacterium]
MNLAFDGKVVVVTGGSGGIGSAIAEAFGSTGATVVVHYHKNRSAAEAVAKSVDSRGGKGIIVGADLSSLDGAREVVEVVRASAGSLDVLVNNSGALIRRVPIAEFDDDLFEAVMALNFSSVFRACRAAIPLLAENGGGSIVNITSVAARNGGGGGSVIYASAKAAVTTFTRGLAKELVPLSIRVNAVAPGYIETPFHEATPADTRKVQIGTIPMGRPGAPKECVGAVLMLASEVAGSYINGQCIEVNGGQLMP